MQGSAALDLLFPQGFVKPQREEPKDPRPLFLASEGIHGIVNVHYDSKSPASSNTDFIKTGLYGNIYIKIAHQGTQTRNTTDEYSKLRKRVLCLVEVISVTPTIDDASSRVNASLKFDFNLPQLLSCLAEKNEHFGSELLPYLHQRRCHPSSLAVRTVLISTPSNPGLTLDARVSYTVQAETVCDGTVLGITSKEILVFDSRESQPPTCTPDFSSEYLCGQKMSLRRHIFQKVGRVFVAIGEPKPFVFCKQKDTLSTKLPISFTLESLPIEWHDPNHPVEALDATITWQLRTSTFMSVEPMSSIPTVKQAISASPIARVTNLGFKRQLIFNIRSWEKMLGDFRTGQGTGWTKGDELTLSIPQKYLLVPTFFTQHLSRHYSLVVQVRVSGHGKETLWLEVPIQVMYQHEVTGTDSTGGRRREESPDLCDDDQFQYFGEFSRVAELPIYIL